MAGPADWLRARTDTVLGEMAGRWASASMGLWSGRCRPSTPDGCAAGDLTDKANPAWTVSASGTLDVLFTDRQLSVIDIHGRAVVVRDAASGAPVTCALVQPYPVTGTTVLLAEGTEAPIPTPFFDTAAGGIAILAIVLLCLLVVVAIALAVMRHYDFTWLPDRWRKDGRENPSAARAAQRRSSSSERSGGSTSELVGSTWTISPLSQRS